MLNCPYSVVDAHIVYMKQYVYAQLPVLFIRCSYYEQQYVCSIARTLYLMFMVWTALRMLMKPTVVLLNLLRIMFAFYIHILINTEAY